MARSLATLLIGLGLVLAAAPACGRKGPLVVPQGQAPMPVEGLRAIARDGAVVLRWTNPAKAISGRPLGPLRAVEIWIFDKGLPAGGGPLTSDAIERAARLFRKIPGRELGAFAAPDGEAAGAMTFTVALPATPPAPAKLAFAVRVIDRKGRASEFSAPVAVDGVPKNAGVDRPAAEGVS